MATPDSSVTYRDEIAPPPVTLPQGLDDAADDRDHRGQPTALAPRSAPVGAVEEVRENLIEALTLYFEDHDVEVGEAAIIAPIDVAV